jgi:hypothetical protein
MRHLSWRVVQIWKTFRVDNRDALASVHLHEVFAYQWPIRNQLLNALGRQ